MSPTRAAEEGGLPLGWQRPALCHLHLGSLCSPSRASCCLLAFLPLLHPTDLSSCFLSPSPRPPRSSSGR